MDDYECREVGGMKIGNGNRSTRRKPALVSLCPPQIYMICPGFEPGPWWKANDCLNYDTASTIGVNTTDIPYWEWAQLNIGQVISIFAS
jgi:hypothetical protein